MRRRPSRKTYLLLEVAIALCIAALCLSPLLHSQLQMSTQTYSELIDLQLRLAAERRYGELLEQLYTHDIEFEEIWQGTRKTKVGELAPAKVNLPRDQVRRYPCHYEISVEDQHHKESFGDFRLYKIVINFDGAKQPFLFYTYAERRKYDTA